jgi:hypothetical protein
MEGEGKGEGNVTRNSNSEWESEGWQSWDKVSLALFLFVSGHVAVKLEPQFQELGN